MAHSHVVLGELNRPDRYTTADVPLLQSHQDQPEPGAVPPMAGYGKMNGMLIPSHDIELTICRYVGYGLPISRLVNILGYSLVSLTVNPL